MNVRTQITLDPDTQQRAQARATELGISFAEYVRRVLTHDLGPKPKRKKSVSTLFDLVDEGPETDIVQNKDDMVSEAVWTEHVRKTRARTPRLRRKSRRR